MSALLRRGPLVLLAFSAACGSSDGGTPPTPVTDNTPFAITITLAGSLTVPANTTPALSATVTAKDGHTITTAGVQWSTGDSRIAVVTSAAIGQPGMVLAPSKAGTTTVTASSGIASASITVTVVPGPAAALGIRSQPTTVPLASPTSTAIIEVQDVRGNLVSSPATVTMAIASGGGTLSGTTSAVAVAGVATFSGFALLGSTGTRTLTFSADGLTSATSAPISVTAPLAAFMVPDSTSIAITIAVGSNAAVQTIRIANSGLAPFTTVTTDPVVYDAGQTPGWLTASVGGGATRTLTLAPSTAPLAIGTYHATVNVNATGALNTPLAFSVTVNVVQTFGINFSSGAPKTRIIDVGSSLPVLTAVLGTLTQPASAVTFVSRATSVATVDATGKITAVGAGQSWVTATAAGAVLADSVFVIVPRNATGPLLRSDIGTYVVHAGDTTVVNFTLDPRSTDVAAATVVVGYETENSMFLVFSATVPTQTPMPLSDNSSPGVFKVNIASATALSGPVVMLQLKLIDRAIGLSGFLTFSVLDAVSSAGADVSASFTSTRYPIIIR